MGIDIDRLDNVFFIGIAGTGMSALAQYLAGMGKRISGSDRYFSTGSSGDVQIKLELAGIRCFMQNGEGITTDTGLVVVSAAVEDTVTEVQKAKQLGIPIVKRSELLAVIVKGRRTIAVGGTSGKSTTSAMLFEILKHAGLEPGIISGAGLVSLMRQGKIGNAETGKGEWLVIEADESDGSIVQYEAEIGVVLNIDKDHQEIDALMDIFDVFKRNTKGTFIVNRAHPLAAKLSRDIKTDFSTNSSSGAGYIAADFRQEGLHIEFRVNGIPFSLHTVGRHNMENALAAVAVAGILDIDLPTCAVALEKYEGIYRRHQVIGNKHGVWLIDDYAHNPAKCAASIAACQYIAPKVIAWFQPHGYGPTRFLRHDFVEEIAAVLRTSDEIWMSEIFYAGGTAVKNISANDLINDLKAFGKKAFFAERRGDFPERVRHHLTDNCVLLLMGARDPSLEAFAQEVWEAL
ncbi:Mur ligase domain-containing protein [Agriterribacter sp.]|uniref:UDP-N-acetylmuramate--L-alanine ligase n=1 Tax=Agriterribacter sp. TaxID=2821509 RepID=UPI002C2DF0BE|nr:Mur ligase domain-containing protein [Agriterribacter sp.]HRP56082.1 Mur ligase domain-containing protein [Agriterribacter sp.]